MTLQYNEICYNHVGIVIGTLWMPHTTIPIIIIVFNIIRRNRLVILYIGIAMYNIGFIYDDNLIHTSF